MKIIIQRGGKVKIISRLKKDLDTFEAKRSTMNYQHILRILPTVIEYIILCSITKDVILNLFRRTASCFLESALERIMRQVVSTIGMRPRLIKMCAMDDVV